MPALPRLFRDPLSDRGLGLIATSLRLERQSGKRSVSHPEQREGSSGPNELPASSLRSE